MAMFRKNRSSTAGRRPLGLQRLDKRLVFAAELSLNVSIDGNDAVTSPGPTLVPGAESVWAYEVTNSGDRPIRGLRLVDDGGTAADPGDDLVAVATNQDASNEALPQGGALLASFEGLRIGKMVVDPVRPRLFATDIQNNEIIELNTGNLTRGLSAELPHRPTGLTLSQDGSRLFISAYDEGDDEGVIVILDANSLDEIDVLDVDGLPQDVEIGADGRLIVLTDSQLIQLDPVTADLLAGSLSVSHSRGELAISPQRDRLYVASLRAPTASLTQVDLTEDPPSVRWQSPIGVLTGSNGQDLAISHDGQHVSYAAGNGQSGFQIARYDTEVADGTSPMSIAGYYLTGAFPREVTYSPDDAVVYTASRLGHIGRFDVDTFELIGEWDVEGNVRELNVDSTGELLYAAFDDALRIYSSGRSVALNVGDVNDNGLLDPGETWSYTLPRQVATGAVESRVLLSGIDSTGVPLVITNTNYYTGESTSVALTTTLQGKPISPNETGSFPVGEALVWRHTVSNTGSNDLENVVVRLNGSIDLSDRYLAGDVNDDRILASGESWIYEVRESAGVGLQTHVVSLSADVAEGDETIVRAENYVTFGVDARIQTQARVNGFDATVVPGPEVGVGDPATLVYEVSNLGNVPLTEVNVIENNGTTRADDDFSPTLLQGDLDSNGVLDSGETWLFLIDQTSVAGVHERRLHVTATDSLDRQVDVTSLANYVGVGGNVNLSVNLLGVTDPAETVRVVPAGELIGIQFLVTNAGTLPLGIPTLTADGHTPDDLTDDLAPFRVNEDSGADGVLSPGEVWDYRIFVSAREGVALMSASVLAAVVDERGMPLPGVSSVSADDGVEYFGGVTAILTDVSTDAVPIVTDSDGSSPILNNHFHAGSPVRWNYQLTNSGNLPLQNVTLDVTDELAVFSQPHTVATGLSPRGTLLAEVADASIHEFVAHPTLPFVFASDTTGNRVLMFNTDSLEVEATFKMGNGPRGMALSPDGARLYVTHADTKNIGVVDILSQTVISSLEIFQIPSDIEVGLDGRLFVLGHSALMQLDPDTGEAVGPTFPVVVSGGEIAINPERTRLYYSNSNLSPAGLFQIDLTGSGATVLWESPSDSSQGGNGQSLALSPAGDFVAHAVAIQGTDLGQTHVKIVVRDTSDMSVVGQYNLGPKTTGVFAQEIAFDPDGRFAYATSQAGVVSIFGASTFAQTSAIGLQGTATEMEVDSSGRFLFASAGGRMMVISTGRASSMINRGDTDFNRKFDPGETWFYQSNTTVPPGGGRHEVQASAENQFGDVAETAAEFRFFGSHLASVNANVLGATVYQDNELQSDWNLSDDRFEILGDTVRLKGDRFLAADESRVEIQLREPDSEVVPRSVLVDIIDVPAWQNLSIPEDVNDDQAITALDALILINRMNENQIGTLGPRPLDFAAFYDVTGDGNLTAVDALRVINALNAPARGASEALEATTVLEAVVSQPTALTRIEDWDSKKRLAWLDQLFATF